MRYNRFPDEKGTESSFSLSLEACSCEVTTVSPMKRGLKVSIGSAPCVPRQMLQPFPR